MIYQVKNNYRAPGCQVEPEQLPACMPSASGFCSGRSSGEVLLDSSLRSKRCVGSTKPRTCVMRPWPPAVAGCRFCSALARRGSCHPSSELRSPNPDDESWTNTSAPAAGSPSTPWNESLPAIGSPRTSSLSPHRPNLFVAGAAPCRVLAVLPMPRASIPHPSSF